MAARRPHHAPPSTAPTFAALGVPAVLVDALAATGVVTPRPIQSVTLPDALAGRDVLGRARTGSGKTYAFALPVLTRLAGGRSARPGQPRALILVPTRELAAQIETAIAPLAKVLGLRTLTVFGGVRPGPQLAGLRAGVDVLVACPGRLADHVNTGHARLDGIEITVLDEADHMADLGFLPGVTRILAATPQGGQRMLFSATLDRGVDTLVRRFLRDEVRHEVDESSVPQGVMTHRVFVVGGTDEKTALVRHLASGRGRRILFTRTKHQAKKLAKQLTDAGIPAVDLHGNLSQPQRDRNLAAFGDGSVKVLVATDVAARGVHVDNVELVIHVDPPMEHKAYLHRSGRTARAGSEGDVVTICLPAQKQDLKTLLRKAAITVAPQQVTAASPSVAALVGEVAPYVKPAPREAKPQQGGGRSQGANAQRKRAARAEQGAGGRGGRRGQSDVAPTTPRRDRSGRPAEAKAHAPKQGAGHGRGAQTSGAQRGASARSSAKQPLRVGSLVSPSRNNRTNRRAQG